jgi:hypothetical protein
VRRIFAKMASRYGDQWAQKFGGVKADQLIADWAEDLADMSGADIARGLAACRDQKYPPGVADFRALCRPQLDYSASLQEAVEQMTLRADGADTWSHPAIFWAAAKVGSFDLLGKSLKELDPIWRREFSAQMAKGEWPAIPERAPALPAPGATHTESHAKQVMAEMMAKLRGREEQGK